MAKILKHLGFGKKPPMPPRVDYNMRSYLGLGMPIRCNSESNLLEAVAEERAINKMTHRSQDDTQMGLGHVARLSWFLIWRTGFLALGQGHESGVAGRHACDLRKVVRRSRSPAG
ncbi:hypothetical protein HPB50_027554 [Hyalomma asiaticum]|uniref:Uncharacterized protein n=1 Tax=Hyalomma asiaticum TaxID=266040 RepID=A0ACB7T676_HYAAI|nr:hypothetical protein HPB50_027554 [Hyalomma asiaticum]